MPRAVKSEVLAALAEIDKTYVPELLNGQKGVGRAKKWSTSGDQVPMRAALAHYCGRHR